MSNKEIIEEVLKSMIKEITHNCGELNEITLTGDNFKKCVKVQLEKALQLKEQEMKQNEIKFLEMLLKWDIDKEDATTDEPIKKRLQELKGK